MIFNLFKRKYAPPRYFKAKSFLGDSYVYLKIEEDNLFNWNLKKRKWCLEAENCGKTSIKVLMNDKEVEEISAEEFEWRTIE